jgi:uncharacterized protein (TIGR03435 family)
MARLPFCLCGVRGGDLKQRIESIMTGRRLATLTRARRSALMLGAVAFIAAPVVVGALTLRSRVPTETAGQEPGAPVVFEVAAVRLNKSGQLAAQFDDLPGGRFIAVNATLRMLILDAYRIPDRQLVDAPDWTRNERFDVNAKLEREAPIVRGTAGERQFALRSLLAERFTLRVHRETRQIPMYALVMARTDRKPGSLLKPSVTDCSADAMRARAAAAQASQPLAGMCGTRATAGRLQFGGRMSDLARNLSGSAEIGRNVVDQTGLTGVWQFELSLGGPPQQRAPGLEPVANDPNAPLLITALQEQLGLKLESIQGPMEFLIVDGVERLDRQDAIDQRP